MGNVFLKLLQCIANQLGCPLNNVKIMAKTEILADEVRLVRGGDSMALVV